jgi:5-formaminoimidazole-4-carboxamide-1-(beta)-D-ribofuranosyl 5'-monophosphate synthetase
LGESGWISTSISPILKYFLKQLCLMAQTNSSIMSPTIAKILSGYDRDNLTIATVTSHTSLQLFDGARKEGLKTIGISIGKPPKFYDAFPLAKPDKFLIVDSYGDILDKARELAEHNTIIIPTGSFVEYLGHEKFMDLELPTFGNRHVLEW